MPLFLVRHAQTEWNSLGIAQGHSDQNLDHVGRTQAVTLGERLRPLEVTTIFSSDLARCLETAQEVARTTRARVVATGYLRERSFGELEGKPYVEVREWLQRESVRLGLPLSEVRPPGGESVLDVWQRAGQSIGLVADLPGPCVVVSHGGMLAAVIARLVGGTVETMRSLRLANASVTELQRREGGGWLLAKFNDTQHLESLIADSAAAS